MMMTPGPLLAFLFASPWTALLAAACAASIPIVIHLLNRRRFRVVTWAAMRFLLAAQKKNTRRMRLEQIILLAVRTLIVLLLVLAMVGGSREEWVDNLWKNIFPQAAGRSLGGGRRTHKILVLDGSFSMALKEGDTTCFDKARAAAAEILESSPSGDGFSVVLMAAPPRRIVADPSDDGGEVAKVVRDPNLRLPHGNADLPATLNAVRDMLTSSPSRFLEKEVYFLTDLQHSTWMGHRGIDETLQAIQAKARVVLVDVGRKDEVGNLAVTSLTLGVPLVTTHGDTPIQAVINNFGNQERKQVRVELLVGKARANEKDPPFQLRVVRQDLIDVPAGSRATVRFKAPPFRAPGDYALQVRVEDDDLEVDDSRTVIVPVKEGVPVMLVDGKPSSGEIYDRATEYLHDALNPYPQGPVPPTVVARPRRVIESQFADAAAGDLTPYDCVFFCDVPRFSATEVRRLETYVRRGGGVVICLGPQVDLEAYNRMLYREGQGILPAHLSGARRAAENSQYRLALDSSKESHELLKAFTGDDRTSLERVRFQQYVYADKLAPQVRSDLPHSEAREILSFLHIPAPDKKQPATARAGDKGPAVIEWTVGRGKVLLVTTAVNMDWSSWPASPSYAAFMQELFLYAVAGRVREEAAVVGDPLERYVLTSGAPVDVTMATPDSRDPPAPTVQTQPYDEEASVLRWSDTAISGIYRATLGQHPQDYLFAVNVPVAGDGQASESDLARTTEHQLRDSYRGWDFQYVTELDQVTHTGGPSALAAADQAGEGIGPVIARMLLFAMLALLLVEVVLAWVFGHYSTVADPSGGAPPSGWVLPAGVAACAAVAFGLLAFVLIHDAFRHDFLAFLGDGIRGWVEERLGVPPPPSGESTRWHLEYTPYFGTAGMTLGLAFLIALVSLSLVIVIYVLEGRTARWPYKLLLGGLRIFLLLLTLAVLLPQLQLSFQRQSRPDIVLLIDVSGSMSASDRYRDQDVREAAQQLAQEAAQLAEAKDQVAAKIVAAAEDKERQVREQPTKGSETLAKEAENLRAEARALKEEAEALRKIAQSPETAKSEQMQRLQLAQALLRRKNSAQLDWLETLLSQRKVKVHIYQCAGRAARLKTITEPEELAEARELLEGLRAKPENDTSQHGSSLRQVLTDFSGRPPAAVIVVTDGVTTQGEDLAKAARDLAKIAKEKKDAPTPLFFVGVGDAHEVRDLKLEGLQVSDSVWVNDWLVFQVQVVGQGYTDLEVPLTLSEKDKDGNEKVLETKKVKVDPHGKPVKVEIRHQPKEPGEKLYVLKVPEQEDEVKPADNNRLERAVYVRETKVIKVLYVEGAPRYDYRYIKHLLERESAREKGNKSIDLRVLLLDADESYAKEDKSALNPPDFPNKTELSQYDVIIFGDVDPRSPKIGEPNLKNVAEFVRERGGGFLMVAGEEFSPHAYKDTPLADILPIEVTGPQPAEPEEGWAEPYHLEVTPVGRSHPIFRFAMDEAENSAICNRLAEMFWWSEGYRPKPLAEVLAVHPKRPAVDPRRPGGGRERHPLVLHQFVGSGRSMFFGFDESWRWRYREDELRFNEFWIQTVRYLSKNRSGRVELHLDRQVPYREGEPIKITVRFPDDAPAPTTTPEVTVLKELPPSQPGLAPRIDKEKLVLAKLEGSRAIFEGLMTRTPNGKYQFWLSAPPVTTGKPHAECRVLPPEGEMDHLRMDQPVMKEAGDVTGGRFFTLADADQLLDALPSGKRVALNTQGLPHQLWNHAILLLLALTLVGMEWFLRKRRHLL
jgi:hypothetical protein